jgi:hypothetical protein
MNSVSSWSLTGFSRTFDALGEIAVLIGLAQAK